MIYYLDDKKININLEKLKKLGKGCQSEAYKLWYNCGTYVLKIRKNESIIEEECNILKKLNTERILLPKQLVYDENRQFIGYMMQYHKNDKKVIKISKQKFMYEIKKLMDEIKYLSDNNIVIDDWNFSNFIFDGTFRLIDSGKYRYSSIDKNKIYQHNYIVLCDFIANKLLYYMLVANTDFPQYYSSRLYQKTKRGIIEFYQQQINDDETVYQYVKRIVKK